jgi:hypothetical protein
MGTRAQIILKEEKEKLWFYRHDDGDPETVIPHLKKFLGWMKEGRIRDNLTQASGWLVVMGHQEMKDSYQKNSPPGEPAIDDDTGMGWKVGAYMPCPPVRNFDINYLYTVDLVEKTISHKKTKIGF